MSSTSDQRKQWAEHIADESRALQAQQQAAGATHSPREGPMPYTADQLEAAISAAVARERQRCAEIAEAWSTEPRLRQTFKDLTPGELRIAAATARAVSGEICGHAAQQP